MVSSMDVNNMAASLNALPNNSMNFTENQHGNAILEKLKGQRDAGRFCDVVLHVQGKQFQAHRNVLAACSPYFDSILKMQKTVKEQLTITCQNHEAFLCLLNYMYTGNVVIDKNNVAELLRLANHFLVTKLKNHCAEYLERYLDITNCFSVKELGEKYSMPGLVKHATNFIQNHVADVLQQKELLDCPLSKVEQFLSDKNWTVPMDGLIKFTSQWVSYNPSCRERDLRTLMTFVNWHAVERNFVASHIDTEPLFKQNPRCFYFILQSLEENGIQLSKYAAVYQDLKAKFGPEAAGSFDSDSFLNMAISTAIEGLQETGGNGPGEREGDSSFDPVTVTVLGKDALADMPKSLKAEAPKEASSCKSKKGFTGSVIPAALLQKGGRRVKPIKLKLGRGLRRKLEVGTCSTVTTTKGRKLKVVRLKRIQKQATRGGPLKKTILLSGGRAGDCNGTRKLSHGAAGLGLSDDDDEVMVERRKGCYSPEVMRGGIKCPHCAFVAQGILKLEQHVARIHSREVTYKCGLCEYTCKWNREYYVHMKQRHFEGPPFRCDTCDFSCDRIQLLLTHRMKHTDDRPFKCEECDYRCRTKNNLLAHARSHSTDRPFKCHVCGRSFAIKGTLDQHLSTHNDQRPFLCDICGFSTKYQSHLIAHKRIHTGEVFRCDFPECSYSSPKKSQLAAHNRTHTAVRSHVCGICGRGFVEKSHLVRHERIHLNEKPFKCDHCDYSSSRRDKLKEHTQKHHGAHPTAKTPYKPRKPRTNSGGSGGSSGGSNPAGKQHPHHHHHHHHHHHPYEAAGLYGARSAADMDQSVLHQAHAHASPQHQQGPPSQQQITQAAATTLSESSTTYTYDAQQSQQQHHLVAAMDLHSKVIMPDLSRSLAAVAAAAAAGVGDHSGNQQGGGQQQGNQQQQQNAPPPPPVSGGAPLPPHSHTVAAVARGQPPPPTMVFDPRYHAAGPTFHHHIPPGLDQRAQQPGMHNLNPQAAPNLPHPSDFSGLSAFMALF